MHDGDLEEIPSLEMKRKGSGYLVEGRLSEDEVSLALRL